MQSKRAFKIVVFLTRISAFLLFGLALLLFLLGLLKGVINIWLILLYSLMGVVQYNLYKSVSSKERWTWFFLMVLMIVTIFFWILSYFLGVVNSSWLLAVFLIPAFIWILLLVGSSDIFLSRPSKSISELLTNQSFLVCNGFYLLLIIGGLIFVSMEGYGSWAGLQLGARKVKQVQKVDADGIHHPTEINDKLAYIAREGEKEFIFYDGEEGERYKSVRSLMEIGSNPAYIAAEGDREFIAFNGTKGKSYDSVSSLIEVNGKPAYIAEQGDNEIVVYDGEERGKSYAITSLVEVNNKLTYVGAHNFLVHGEEEIGREYDAVKSPVEINGKLAYVAAKNGKSFLVHGGKEGRKYDSISDLIEIDNKPAYIAEKSVNGLKSEKIIVYDGTEKEKFYNDTIAFFSSFTEINDELVYSARKDGKDFIVYGGKKERYDLINNPIEVNDKLAYKVREEGKAFVVYDGLEGKKYDLVSNLSEVNNKLAYAAERYPDEFIVYDKTEGREYDWISRPIEVGDQLVYTAQQGNQCFIVKED